MRDALTAIDVLMVMLGLGVVGLGVWTGVIRQLTLLAALYFGLLLAAQLYPLASAGLGLIFVRTSSRLLDPVSYLAVFCVATVAMLYLSYRAYRVTKFRSYPQLDQVGGGLVGAVNGLLAVIVAITMLALMTGVSWPAAEDVRLALKGELELSQTPGWVRAQAGAIYWLVTPWVPKGLAGVPSG